MDSADFNSMYKMYIETFQFRVNNPFNFIEAMKLQSVIV